MSWSRRVVSVFLVWLAATAFGLAVAALTKVGPVVFGVTSGHGVHLGDLIAFIAAYAAAVVPTANLLRRPGRHRAYR